MNIRIIATALLITTTTVGITTTVTAQRHATHATQATAEQIHTLINKHRVSIGLKPLKMNDAINKEAVRHSKNMAGGKVSFGHDGFDVRSDRLMSGIKGANASGENVEYTTGDAERVVYNWLHSPHHKKNIEGDFTLTGIGVATAANGQTYYTQIFIKN